MLCFMGIANPQDTPKVCSCALCLISADRLFELTHPGSGVAWLLCIHANEEACIAGCVKLGHFPAKTSRIQQKARDNS